MPLSPIQSIWGLRSGAGAVGIRFELHDFFVKLKTPCGDFFWFDFVTVFEIKKCFFCCYFQGTPCKILDDFMRGRRIRTPHPRRIHIFVSFMRAPRGSCIPKWRGSRRHKLEETVLLIDLEKMFGLLGRRVSIDQMAFVCASMHHAFRFMTFSRY